MKTLKISLVSIVSSILLFSCHKYPNVSVDNEALDMTVTIGDEGRNFSQYNTFTISDTIRLVKILNNEQVESDSVLNSNDAAYVVAELRKKMTSYGYTYTADTSAADLHLIAHVVDVTAEGGGVNCHHPGHWWGYYPGWGYPGWGYPGYGYPWYGGCYSYSFFNRRGTLVWDMFDRKNFDGSQIEVVWTASIVSVLNKDVNTNIYNRIDRGINEAFSQSKYLDKTTN